MFVTKPLASYTACEEVSVEESEAGVNVDEVDEDKVDNESPRDEVADEAPRVVNMLMTW